MLRHWLLLGAILLGFFFLFVPFVLWVLDKLFSRILEQRLFAVKWRWGGVAVSLLLWLVWWVV
jgi:hypothetical protein